MTRKQAIEALEDIQTELGSFRTKHGQATYEYHTEKSEYTVQEARYIKDALDSNPTKTKVSLKEVFAAEHEKLYTSYKEAKGHMEGLDRTLRNLDAQRSIIQTILNQMVTDKHE